MTMAQHIGLTPAAVLHRAAAWAAAAFAGVAWLLGAVGLYSVLAYLVSQRTREIGIRMALGAERGSVSRLVVREAGVLAVTGIVFGLGAAAIVGVLLRALLFETMPWDAPTFGSAAVALGVSALAASYIPARRASSVNPIEALREE